MILRIGQGSAESTSVTIPAGHQVGDIIVIFAFRDGSAVNPTVPAGWTTVTNTLDGTSCSASVGWKVAASNAETSGTWTNATGMMVVVLRNNSNSSPVISNTGTGGAGTTVTYGAITDSDLLGAGGYYIFAFAAHRSTNTSLATPPTGMSNVINAQGGATQDMAMHEVVGEAGSWASQNVSVGGTSAGWATIVMVMRKTRPPLNNFEQASASVGNSGIISVSERVQ